MLAAVLADEPRDALAHLVGRLVREGDRQDVARLGVPVADQVRDAVVITRVLPDPAPARIEQRRPRLERRLRAGRG